ncbi:exodeoxyribonuclease VII small subunit [Scopulibacillus daqui]|uniref:Exodeoxyribonuclease 7 small subunit n=1 Tax=Scopulibacillus daqui TaxID=1469162 RepID=A0ABS2Q1Z0_9BACL|nr:exodeoxyribonuclease VII small subunit [Scopulibacillus daqui]MBM7646318.1 exodeoxyribonuclease VII small subunit [Scopulibacillus daqui]
MSEEKKKENEQHLSFEEAMANLEEIVKRLEENDVPLEEAIDLFQQGVSLSKQCHQRLQKVEEKMDQIIEADEIRPFKIQEEDMGE